MQIYLLSNNFDTLKFIQKNASPPFLLRVHNVSKHGNAREQGSLIFTKERRKQVSNRDYRHLSVYHDVCFYYFLNNYEIIILI